MDIVYEDNIQVMNFNKPFPKESARFSKYESLKYVYTLIVMTCSALMEGVTKYLRKKDRTLTEKYLKLAYTDHFNPIYNDHFIKVKRKSLFSLYPLPTGNHSLGSWSRYHHSISLSLYSVRSQNIPMINLQIDI